MRVKLFFSLLLLASLVKSFPHIQEKCKTTPTLAKKIQHVIPKCQEEVQHELLEETFRLYYDKKLQIPEHGSKHEETTKAHESFHHKNRLIHTLPNYDPGFYHFVTHFEAQKPTPNYHEQLEVLKSLEIFKDNKTELEFLPTPLPLVNLETSPEPAQGQTYDFRVPNLHAKLAAEGKLREKRESDRRIFNLFRGQKSEFFDDAFEADPLDLKENQWVAGCLMQCALRHNRAINQNGWPTLDGLVQLFTEGVHEQEYFMTVLRSVDSCLKAASKKHKVHRDVKPEVKAELCYVAFDVFDCVTDKVLDYCKDSSSGYYGFGYP